MNNSISIKVNGKNSTLDGNTLLSDAITLWGIKGPFAITVNAVLVPRVQYTECKLNDGDVVDVIYPIQGG